MQIYFIECKYIVVFIERVYFIYCLFILFISTLSFLLFLYTVSWRYKRKDSFIPRSYLHYKKGPDLNLPHPPSVHYL